MQDIIKTKLQEGLAPSLLEIEDFSARHAGHAGARDGGESHFHVKIESENFRNLGKIEQHRLVYQILAFELKDKIHALTLETLIPNRK